MSAISAWWKWRIRYYGGAAREFKLLLGSRSHSAHIPLWHNQVLSPSCQSQCTPELFIRLYFIYVCISPMPPEKVGGSWALWQPWMRSRRLSSLKQTLGGWGCRGVRVSTLSHYPCTSPRDLLLVFSGVKQSGVMSGGWSMKRLLFMFMVQKEMSHWWH